MCRLGKTQGPNERCGRMTKGSNAPTVDSQPNWAVLYGPWFDARHAWNQSTLIPVARMCEPGPNAPDDFAVTVPSGWH